MERIAPLAKILAEANGIEWEQLQGTGAGGTIVEQDILDYLSRVMSGEAEPPSTPVDAPPPDWNGEDLPGGGMFDANMLSRAGVESDIADFVQQSRSATPAPASAPAAADDFELDDAQDDLLVPNAPAHTPAPSPFAVPPMMAAVPTPSAVAAPARSPFDVPPVTPSRTDTPPAQPTPAPAPAPATPGGLGSLLSRLYHQGGEAQAPTPPAAPPITPVTPAPSPVTPPPAPVRSEPPAAQPAPPLQSPPVSPERPEVAEVAAQVPLSAPTAPPLPEPVAPPVTTAPLAPEPARPPASTLREEVEESVLRSSPSPEPMPQVERFAPPADPAPAVTPAAELAPAVPNPPAAQAAPSAEAPAAQGAVWFGTYLRREADVSQLCDLRTQLSEALGREVPLGLLVARAAQRHAAGLGLENVAVQGYGGHQAQQIGGAVGSSVSLRDALQAFGEPHGGTPDLLVVDAGALDLDDLHYPHTLTLSVGRVQEGRAGLSLQGDVDPEKAARFLASVAQTLEKPVILLI